MLFSGDETSSPSSLCWNAYNNTMKNIHIFSPNRHIINLLGHFRLLWGVVILDIGVVKFRKWIHIVSFLFPLVILAVGKERYFSFLIWWGLISCMLFGKGGLNISIAAMLLALMMRMCWRLKLAHCSPLDSFTTKAIFVFKNCFRRIVSHYDNFRIKMQW